MLCLGNCTEGGMEGLVVPIAKEGRGTVFSFDDIQKNLAKSCESYKRVRFESLSYVGLAHHNVRSIAQYFSA